MTPDDTAPAPALPPAPTYEPPAGILVGGDVIKGADVVEILPETLTDIEDAGRASSSPRLVPYGIVRSADPDNHTTFTQVHRAWILPELARRIAAGGSMDALTPVWQALVVFPPRSAPERHRVLLNEEVKTGAIVRPAYVGTMTPTMVGQTMQLGLRDMFDLRGFTLDGVDMETDGFLWIRPESGLMALYFNFLPNSSFPRQASEADRQQIMRAVQDAIAQEMLQSLARGVFTDTTAIRDAMAADGWCPTPILLPEVWRQMCDAYRRNDPAEAERLALAAVGPGELDMMFNSWVAEEPFTSDRPFLQRGIEHYKAGDFISSVSVLLPRIEGLANRVRERRGIGARDSLREVFATLEQLASADVRDGYIATRVREEFAALIATFLLVRFYPTDPGADAVLGRHAHAHGATGDLYYDQRYALKILLAIDAMHFVAR